MLEMLKGFEQEESVTSVHGKIMQQLFYKLGDKIYTLIAKYFLKNEFTVLFSYDMML